VEMIRCVGGLSAGGGVLRVDSVAVVTREMRIWGRLKGITTC